MELVEVGIGVLRAIRSLILRQSLRHEMGAINRSREGWVHLTRVYDILGFWE